MSKDDQVGKIVKSSFAQEPEAPSGELNLRVFQSLARYVRNVHGVNELERIAGCAGLSVDQFDGKSHWAALFQVEEFLKQIDELNGGDEASFMDACVYQFKESMGPFGFILKAIRPRTVYELGTKNHALCSRISEQEILDVGNNHIVIKYISSKSESRLLCLIRLAQMAYFPRLFGLPQAVVSESSCIAKGDDACVYHLKWYEARRWLPIALGGSLGGIAAAMLALLGQNVVPVWITLPLFGGLLGYCRELRRTAVVNMAIGEEMDGALRQMAEQDAEARSEMFSLHRRQKEWTGLMEEQVTDRTERLENVLDRVKNLQQSRHSAILGFSHDLRNPLNVLRMSTAFFREGLRDPSDDFIEVLDGQDDAIDDMDTLLNELMEMSKSDMGLVKITPQTVPVETITDQLRKRLRALVFGREIRTSVFSNREAPETVETDLLVFNRVMDNLLTNAAKYTARGSIVIELDGRPGFLTIKISDTGRGIAQESIKKIFERSGSEPRSRERFSHGVGLSVVVQLMAQMGGNIEVMSKLGEGSTFWIHFPVSLTSSAETEKEERLRQQVPLDELVSKVVTFREVN